MAKTKNPDNTRHVILDAAFQEIHRYGFQSASVERILADTGLTKGALYHHFPNKLELGYAVVDGPLAEYLKKVWLDPIEGATDPIEALKETLLSRGESPELYDLGCPINNLTQEMSQLDEGFRKRLKNLLKRWCDALETALERGKERGVVREDVNSRAAAGFIVVALEGLAGMSKSSRDMERIYELGGELLSYINSLKSQ